MDIQFNREQFTRFLEEAESISTEPEEPSKAWQYLRSRVAEPLALGYTLYPGALNMDAFTLEELDEFLREGAGGISETACRLIESLSEAKPAYAGRVSHAG